MAWVTSSSSQLASTRQLGGTISDELTQLEHTHHDTAIKGAEVHNIGIIDV